MIDRLYQAGVPGRAMMARKPVREVRIRAVFGRGVQVSDRKARGMHVSESDGPGPSWLGLAEPGWGYADFTNHSDPPAYSGVLRLPGDHVAWKCAHRHESQVQAVSCASHRQEESQGSLWPPVPPPDGRGLTPGWAPALPDGEHILGAWYNGVLRTPDGRPRWTCGHWHGTPAQGTACAAEHLAELDAGPLAPEWAQRLARDAVRDGDIPPRVDELPPQPEIRTIDAPPPVPVPRTVLAPAPDEVRVSFTLTADFAAALCGIDTSVPGSSARWDTRSPGEAVLFVFLPPPGSRSPGAPAADQCRLRFRVSAVTAAVACGVKDAAGGSVPCSWGEISSAGGSIGLVAVPSPDRAFAQPAPEPHRRDADGAAAGNPAVRA